MLNLGSNNGILIVNANQLASNHQGASSLGSRSVHILGAIQLGNIVGLAGIEGSGLLVVAALFTKSDNLGLDIGGDNLVQIQHDILALVVSALLVVHNQVGLSQGTNSNISLVVSTGGVVRNIASRGGLTIGDSGVLSRSKGKGHLILANGNVSLASTASITLNGVRRERGGAQCQSHDHGQHSCNDLLHVCFLHKNLFVSDSASSSETAFTT